MSEKLRAIVVCAKERKEKDKDILLFSLEKGKVWATLKGVKGANAKMKLAQPFAFGEFILEEGKAGFVVTSFESLESFYEISQDVEKYFEASAILEIIKKLEFVGEECAKLFVLTLKSLKTICFEKVKNVYVLNKFLLELYKIYGCPLNWQKCAGCGSVAFDKLYINYAVGELVCSACKNQLCEEISKATYSALKILSEFDFSKLNKINLAKGSEISLLRLLSKNFEARFSSSLSLMGILS